MTTDKDPQVERPGTPDPGPGTEASSAPSDSAPSPSGRSQGARDEADEPIENRFPDDEGGEHRESG
jgi:hypothetical protein